MQTKKIPLVDLQAQYRLIKDEIDLALGSIIENSSFIKGEPLKKFEDSFAQYCDSRACVGVGNGTDALTLALRGSGIRPGDEVIVPTAGSCGVAKERMESKDENTKCYDWFFCTKKIDKETVLKKILKK